MFEGVSDAFLGSFDIPDAVAGEEDELCVSGDGDNFDVGERGDSLIFGLVHRVVLVFEISESSGEGEHSVDSAFLNEASCVLDAFELDWVVRFVVLGELDRDTVLGHDSTGVTSVSADDFSLGD